MSAVTVGVTVGVVLWVLLFLGRRVRALQVAHLAEGGWGSLSPPHVSGGQARTKYARAIVGVISGFLLFLFFRSGTVVWDEQGDRGASGGPVEE